MKRLMIFAATAAVAALALTGGASAKSESPSAQSLLSCLQLEHEQRGVCADTDTRATVASALDGKTGRTATPFDETGGLVPQSLTQ